MLNSIEQVRISDIITKQRMITDITNKFIDEIIKKSIDEYTSRIIIHKFIKKYYWNWKEKFEKKRMHPNSKYLINIVNNFD